MNENISRLSSARDALEFEGKEIGAARKIAGELLHGLFICKDAGPEHEAMWRKLQSQDICELVGIMLGLLGYGLAVDRTCMTAFLTTGEDEPRGHFETFSKLESAMLLILYKSWKHDVQDTSTEGCGEITVGEMLDELKAVKVRTANVMSISEAAKKFRKRGLLRIAESADTVNAAGEDMRNSEKLAASVLIPLPSIMCLLRNETLEAVGKELERFANECRGKTAERNTGVMAAPGFEQSAEEEGTDKEDAECI